MSDFEFGDIAWADGKAWWRSPECDSTFLPEAWESRDGASPLSDLRRHDDFTWLVLNGQREVVVTPPKVDLTEPLLHESADGTVTLEWRDDRTATLVSRELLDHMVASRNSATTGTVSNPAWRRGYDAGINAERRAIVAWLRQQPFLIEWPWAAAAGIERGEHLRGDDE